MKTIFFYFFLLISFSVFSQTNYCEECTENFVKIIPEILATHSGRICWEEPTPEIFWQKREYFLNHVINFCDLIYLYVNCPSAEAKNSLLPVFYKNWQYLMNCCSGVIEINTLKLLAPNNDLRIVTEKEIMRRNYYSYSSRNFNSPAKVLDLIYSIRIN